VVRYFLVYGKVQRVTLKMDIRSLIDSNIHLAIYCGMNAMQEISSVEFA